MPEQKYKVLVTTSGVGQRLGDFTKHANQSLVRLLKKPILSHIVESYPEDVEIVVTLGYFGNLVKEFLQIAYPERQFTFVEVEKFQGEGSSLVRSMLDAKAHLQCPFIFHAGDTVVMEPIANPLQENWCGGHKGSPNANYRSFIELDDKVLAFREKGSMDFDYLHIGLIGIKDFEKFWQVAEQLYGQKKNEPSLGDVPVLSEMIKQGVEFEPKEFKTWLDMGNVDALYQARQKLGDFLVNLDKETEATYIFDENFVVKFMDDEQGVISLVERAKTLEGLVPEMQSRVGHFFRYNFARGRLYARAASPPDFKEFLEWCEKKLWKKVEEVSAQEFEKRCLKFYRDKTLRRVQDFYEISGISDGPTVINNEPVPALSEILEKVDFNWLAKGEQRIFHGDLILDNVIKTRDSFVLLDWREDFAGLKQAGDMYYDLAKLNHNLTINHDLVFQNQYEVKVRGKVVTCDILRSDNLSECQKVLWEFIAQKGFDLKKVKILTAIAWLNMAPLHHHPYNYFLYYFGKLNLWKAINN